MPPTGLDQHSTKVEPANVGKITLGDVDGRAKPSDTPNPHTSDNTPVQPLTRQTAEQNITDIGDRRNVDPGKTGDIASKTYEIKNTPEDRNNALKEHRETTTTTGFAGPKVVTDSNGQQMKGIQSFDKNTGETHFHQQNNDGTYTQYRVQDNGKSLQKLDGNGKPTGDVVNLQSQTQYPHAPHEATNTQTQNPRVPHEATNTQTRNPHAPHEATNTQTQNPHVPHEATNTQTPNPRVPHENTQNSNAQQQLQIKDAPKPQTINPHEPAQPAPQPVQRGPEPTIKQAPEQTIKTTQQEVFVPRPPRPAYTQPPEMLYQKHESAPTIPEQGNRGYQQQPGRYQEPINRSPDPVQRTQEFRPVNPQSFQNQPRPFQPESRPDLSRPDANRPDSFRPDSYRPDAYRPDAFRPDTSRPTPIQKVDARPDRIGDTPGFRPLTEPRTNDPTRPSPVSLRPDQIQLKPGQDGPHGPAIKVPIDGVPRGLDLRPSSTQPLDAGKLPFFNLKAELNVKPFIDANRLELHSQLPNNVRILPSEHLNQIYKTIGSQQGDFGIKPQNKIGAEGERTSLVNKPADARLNPSEFSLAARQLALNPAGQQMSRFLEFLGKNQQLDRIPNTDQSRLMMREFMQNLRLDQSTNRDLTNQSWQIQRSLNQRSLEAGTQNPASQILKPQSLETTRELLSLIKTSELIKLNDLISKDPARTLEINKTTDAKVASILNDSKTIETRSGKEAEVKAIRDLNEQKDIQIGKNQQQTLTVDRRLGAENKPDSQQVKQASTDNTNGGKSANQEDKKGKHGDSDKKDKQPDNVLQADLAILLANKLKDLKDKEAREKEKERAQEKGKKDPQQKTRLKYRIKEKDTLGQLAGRFLQDSNLASAIFHINRTVIPVIVHNDKTYASLPVNQMIWIPCDDDIESFKATGAAKQYAHIGFDGIRYSSPEEELAARFGRRWFGPASNENMQASKEQSRKQSNIQKLLGEVTEVQVRKPSLTAEERAARRSNIEKVLGPFSTAPTNGPSRYTVRLGETLKSIALKHPLLNSVDTWRLLASVNGLPIETDEKGAPVATLKRGMTLIMPSAEELKAYREFGVLPTKQLDFTPEESSSDSRGATRQALTLNATIIEQPENFAAQVGNKN